MCIVYYNKVYIYIYIYIKYHYNIYYIDFIYKYFILKCLKIILYTIATYLYKKLLNYTYILNIFENIII